MVKVSEITVKIIADYMKLDEGDYDAKEIAAYQTVAVNYISEYTGIPIEPVEEGQNTLDDYEDFYIVVLILCQDMYDNRTRYVDTKQLNRTVETILDMHCVNLIAE